MYNHNYYIEHKEKYRENNKKWRQEHKERFYELVKKSRTKKAKELKEQGLEYVWHSEKERKRLYERRNERINRSIEEKKIRDNSNE